MPVAALMRRNTAAIAEQDVACGIDSDVGRILQGRRRRWDHRPR